MLFLRKPLVTICIKPAWPVNGLVLSASNRGCVRRLAGSPAISPKSGCLRSASLRSASKSGCLRSASVNGLVLSASNRGCVRRLAGSPAISPKSGCLRSASRKVGVCGRPLRSASRKVGVCGRPAKSGCLQSAALVSQGRGESERLSGFPRSTRGVSRHVKLLQGTKATSALLHRTAGSEDRRTA